MEKWSQKFSVDIPFIDGQHQELFKLVEELSTAVEQGLEIDKSYTMARLEVYSLYHFTSEEHLMKKYDYPGMDSHLKEHKEFRVKIMRFKNEFLEGGEQDEKMAREIVKFLENWIASHILVIDKKYSPYLSGKVEE